MRNMISWEHVMIHKVNKYIALSLLLLVAAATPAESLSDTHRKELSTTYRVMRLFHGCWNVERPKIKKSPWPPSQTTRCFQRGRLLYGSTMDAGHGWDFCERWRVDGSRLAMHDSYGNAQSCLYAFSEDFKILFLRDCPSAGDWQRRKDLDENEPSCRRQNSIKYSDDTDARP